MARSKAIRPIVTRELIDQHKTKPKGKQSLTERLREYGEDFSKFYCDLNIEAGGNVRKLKDVIAPFQQVDFDLLQPGMEVCAGRRLKTKHTKMRAWLERCRGSSKTQDIAICCLYLLLFSKKQQRGVVHSCDRDQSKLVKNAIETITRLNPWIGKLIDIQNWSVTTTGRLPAQGSILEIESSDTPSSWGKILDFICLDEASHLPANAEDLFHSCLSTAAKKKHCLFWICSNAGFKESFQYPLMQAAMESPDWIFSKQTKPAPWISKTLLDEQKHFLPPEVYARLFENEWQEGTGNGGHR
jgi:hypothetical protein